MKGPEERHFQNARIRFAQTVEKQRLYLTECQRQLDAIVAKVPDSKDYQQCLNEAAHAKVAHGMDRYKCELWRHLHDGRCQRQQSSLDMPNGVSLDTDYRAEAEDHVLLVIEIKT